MKKFQAAAKRKIKKHSKEPSNAAVGLPMGNDAKPPFGKKK